ncbi:tetratricopeptide repeat protein [Rubinisphaera margarita]|uniref:tetratricopeptide repeat protein n=1 Tax=Rubinisphaera margarita TaxID=2909586 RepID=UPI001EE8CDD5|nr:tetratricopeptide repeat protein [Rubinisphaera margarita]MCG6157843.1 tetratricopeptide repeat protein [Rubinisphaera margarita]
MTRPSDQTSTQPVGSHSASGERAPHIPLPNDALSRAMATHQQGDLATAMQTYEQILGHEPDHADALHLSGVVLHQQGEHRAAMKRIERALQLKPASILYRKNLASATRAAGDLPRARQLCEEVLASEPNDAIVQQMLGRVLEQLQDYRAALVHFRNALEGDLNADDRFEVLIHAGDCYSRLGERKQAIRILEQTHAERPNQLLSNHNLGREYHFAGDLVQAEKYYLRSLEIDRNCASAWNNLGVIYQTRAEYQKSRNCLEEAMRIMPQLADVSNNLANVYEAFGIEEKLQPLYEQAIQLRPDYAEAHHSLSQVHLRNEEFITGWELYAWRRRKQDHDHRPYQHPVWEGTSVSDGRLLIFSEQGIGDVVMFATCLPDVLNKTGNVTLEVDRRMQGLLARSFPNIETIPRPEVDPPAPLTLPGVASQISLADLPSRYRLSRHEFPRQKSILVPDPQLRNRWRSRFAELGDGLKVGISWFGGKNADLQTRRAIPLRQWGQLLRMPGVHFVNLQYGDHQQEIDQVCSREGVTLHNWADCDPLADLENFAAEIAELDLVISIDNATIHFAGGLGTPTWCLLHQLADWRWFHDDDTTPWYESLRLFRQSTQGDWQPVLHRVAEELSRQAGGVAIPEVTQQFDAAPTIPQSPTLPVVPVSSGLKPRCAVISPVGPGHAEIYSQAERSIRNAALQSAGPFREIIPFRIDDTAGKIGRSRARNHAVQRAAEMGIEWVFFLDADDLMVPNAFAAVGPYLDRYDAIWGQIFSFDDGTEHAVQRENQLGQTDRFDDVLNSDPYLSLQIGHFVRTEIALRHPFNESLDVGEDFDYYLRLWESQRCIKTDQAFFANRRGRHSTGPRAGTGRDWTIRVNEMMRTRRLTRLTTPVSGAAPITSVTAPMKVAIYGMMRSGTTLLCDKLTVPGRGLVLLEPNIHMPGWPFHICKQLNDFGIPVQEEDWRRASQSESFQSYFNREVLPRLQELNYWGVKMVNFADSEKFLNAYPPEHLILCVRDMRDVVLSAQDLAPKLGNFVDEAWIEKRALETAAALVKMARRPHTLMRYEDMCSRPRLIEDLAARMGLPRPGDHRLSLDAVPHRLYENTKHEGKVSRKSIQRFDSEPEGPRKELARKVWEKCGEFNELFGYSTRVKSTPVGEVSAPQADTNIVQHLDSFWKQDQLANIIPRNEELGAFPEGWDVRPHLWELLRIHLQRRIVEVGCGYGRLCQAFPTDYYVGVDINPEAVEQARRVHPGYEFQSIDFCDDYPKADAIMAYTVLLHIDDDTIGSMLERICRSTDVVLIAEIMGKARWRRGGNPPVFNRDAEDYVELMRERGFFLTCQEERPYKHYPDTNITFLKFERSNQA